MKAVYVGVFAACSSLLASTQSDVIHRIDSSVEALSEIMQSPDRGIPRDLMQRAHCVGIVPSLKRAGFIVGAKYGKGIITCRTDVGSGWSAPSTIVIEGGNIGLQIGLGETDVVFAVMNASGENRLMKDKFTIGSEAAAMVGPLGRDAQAQTDALMRAEILSWSRSRGVFAGVSLDGASLRADNDDNEALYGRRVTQQELLHGHVAPPEVAGKLYDELNSYAPAVRSGG
ncbi:MAG: lipid-binding SYLF domain-containing protein [Bryobacteraceae bacterium]|jgi:lipid-binding SYLF domain-containing protein